MNERKMRFKFRQREKEKNILMIKGDEILI